MRKRDENLLLLLKRNLLRSDPLIRNRLLKRSDDQLLLERISLLGKRKLLRLLGDRKWLTWAEWNGLLLRLDELRLEELRLLLLDEWLLRRTALPSLVFGVRLKI